MTDNTNDEAKLKSQIENLASELANLRRDMLSEFGTIRTEAQNARVERAETHVSYMRNWLGLLTFTITIAFVVFGILGYSRWSDIKSAREQVQSDAAKYRSEMQKDMNDMTAQKQQVDAAAHQADQAAGGLLTRFGAVERKVENVETRLDKADKVLNFAQQSAQQSRIDTSNILTNFEGLGSSPLILKVPTWTVVKKTVQSEIEGINFGEARGHLYAYVEWLPATVSFLSSIQTQPAFPQYSAVLGQNPLSSGQPDESQRIEISSSSILEWHNTTVTFTFSSADYEAVESVSKRLKSAASAFQQQLGLPTLSVPSAAYLSFRVVDANGQSSGLSSTMQWPWQD